LRDFSGFVADVQRGLLATGEVVPLLDSTGYRTRVQLGSMETKEFQVDGEAEG
jgi:hypothetical protein